MNEQTNKLLSDLIQKASNGIDSAVSFSQAQMPDAIQQLIHWKITSLSMTLIALLLSAIFLIVVIKKSISLTREGDHVDEVIAFAGIFLSSIAIFMDFIFFAVVR